MTTNLTEGNGRRGRNSGRSLVGAIIIGGALIGGAYGQKLAPIYPDIAVHLRGCFESTWTRACARTSRSPVRSLPSDQCLQDERNVSRH